MGKIKKKENKYSLHHCYSAAASGVPVNGQPAKVSLKTFYCSRFFEQHGKCQDFFEQRNGTCLGVCRRDAKITIHSGAALLAAGSRVSIQGIACDPQQGVTAKQGL